MIEGEQMAALLATTEKVVSIISRGQVYESVYLRDVPADTLSKNLESALTGIYKTALILLYEAGDMFAQSTPKRVLRSLIKPGHVSGGLEGIGKQEDDLLRTVSACEVRRSDNADNSILEKIGALDIPIKRVDEAIQHLVQDMDREKHIKMLEWISDVPFGKNHDHAKKNKTPGTSEWILKDSKFIDWMQDEFPIFWTQGSPGTGKTYLTSTVVDHIRSDLSSFPRNEGFAFFYCDKNEPKRSQPLSILQSIVRQLSTTVEHPETARIKLKELCDQCRESGSDLDLQKCQEQIQESSEIYERTTIVIDALDECDQDSRYELIDALEYLTTQISRPVKVYISSRPNPQILNQFGKTPDVEINASLNTGDIQRYLEAELTKVSKRAPVFRRMKEEIIDELLRRCDGMFQWTFLQLKQIQSCISDEAVRSRLKDLPKGLIATYDQLWGQIEELDEHDRAYVHRALRWVIAAENPFSVSNLLCAIRVNTTGEAPPLADEIDEEGLISLCKNLLTIDSNLDVWRFSHLSVREYLETKLKWTLPQAKFHAASACLSWFITMYGEGSYEGLDSSTRFQDPPAPTDISHAVHPFHLYMRHQWIHHVQRAEDDDKSTLQSLLKKFVGSTKESSQQYQKWYELTELDPKFRIKHMELDYSTDEYDEYSVEYHLVGGFEYKEDREILRDTAVHAMSYDSFPVILFDWWRDGEFDSTQQSKQGNDVLKLATLFGCTEICKMIIERGPDVNFEVNSESHMNALMVACERGHTDIAKYLVDAGADVNRQITIGDFGSALVAAAHGGHTDIVKHLVGAGADVNLQITTGNFGSVLVAAAHGGHLEIVKYLIESGADVNMITEKGNFSDALTAARDREQAETVDYLLNTAGADDSPCKEVRMVFKSTVLTSYPIMQTSNPIARERIYKK